MKPPQESQTPETTPTEGRPKRQRTNIDKTAATKPETSNSATKPAKKTETPKPAAARSKKVAEKKTSKSKVVANATANTTKAKKRATGKPTPKLVFEGEPDEALEGGWPEGWTKKTYQRMSGASKGGHDRYWYTPKTQFKLRSMVEVRRFLRALDQTNGDEDKARKIFKKL